MKKTLLFVATLALAVACNSAKEPVEKLIPKTDVELTGNGFEIFRLGSDVRLVTVQNPDDADEWTIRASVPLMKMSEAPITETEIMINLLDASGMKVRDGFSLKAEDLIDLVPKFNAEKNVEKNIVFSYAGDGKKYFGYKEAVEMLDKVKALTMNVNVVEAVPVAKVEPEKKAEKKAEAPKPLTLNSLLAKYDIKRKLDQYDTLLKNKEKKKAKQLEDELFRICKKVKADPSVPENLSKQFRDYIEDKEDEIEDRY